MIIKHFPVGTVAMMINGTDQPQDLISLSSSLSINLHKKWHWQWTHTFQWMHGGERRLHAECLTIKLTELDSYQSFPSLALSPPETMDAWWWWLSWSHDNNLNMIQVLPCTCPFNLGRISRASSWSANSFVHWIHMERKVHLELKGWKETFVFHAVRLFSGLCVCVMSYEKFLFVRFHGRLL